jgi:methionyl-tRNA formyltransferase
METEMRALFFGSPEIAVPSLQALSEVADIVGVVTQPDRPAGRGLGVQAPAVKVAALEMGIPVYQPLKVRDGELERYVRNSNVAVALVIAYGRILPSGVLSAPRVGCLNLHASLLPRHRGAAPIQRALMAGDTETGVCLMQMDDGMDTGPVLTRLVIPIDPADDAGSLAVKVAQCAAKLTRESLAAAVSGKLIPVPQDSSLATHAPPITNADCAIDWARTARELVSQIRGLAPRPGAETNWNGPSGDEKRLKILAAREAPAVVGEQLAPGTVRVSRGRPWVAAGGGSFLEILSGQLPGKKAVHGTDLVNGRALVDGTRLRSVSPPPLVG